MVNRRTFIAFLAGIPFFPTSLLPKEKPGITEKEFNDLLEDHVFKGYDEFCIEELGRPWEVHCFDKDGNETVYISSVQRNKPDEMTITIDMEHADGE